MKIAVMTGGIFKEFTEMVCLLIKRRKLIIFVVAMITLLHDVYDHKFFDGDIEEKLEETLKELGIYNYMEEK